MRNTNRVLSRFLKRNDLTMTCGSKQLKQSVRLPGRALSLPTQSKSVLIPVEPVQESNRLNSFQQFEVLSLIRLEKSLNCQLNLTSEKVCQFLNMLLQLVVPEKVLLIQP